MKLLTVGEQPLRLALYERAACKTCPYCGKQVARELDAVVAVGADEYFIFHALCLAVSQRLN